MDNQGRSNDSDIGDLYSKSNSVREDYEKANNLESSTSNGKSFEVDAEIDQESVNSRYDLCESIPGLYRLLDLCKDIGSNGLGTYKRLILYICQHLKKLCNEMIPNSFKSISKIQFEQLNSCRVRLIGCYGRNGLIAKLLFNKNVIDQVTYEQLLMPYEINAINPLPTLRPGIYLQKLPSVSEGINSNTNQFLVIHWSENGCYEDSASSYRKKNMTNLHRDVFGSAWLAYMGCRQPKRFILTIILVTDSDVENFDWSLLNENFDDEDGGKKKNRAVIHNFELPLSMSNIQNSYAPKYLDGPPLHPLIVESASNQILLTQKMKSVTTAADKYSRRAFDSLTSFQEYFKQKLKIRKCALSIDRDKMTIQKLQVLVEDGINNPNIFSKYYEELKVLENNKVKIVGKVLENTLKHIEKIAYQMLNQSYNHFESLISDHKNDGIQLGEENESLTSDHKLNDKIQLREDKFNSIDEIPSGVILTLENEIFNISTNNWKYLKTRLIFANHCDYIKASTVFFDEERDFSKLVKKHEKKCILFCISKGLYPKGLTNKIVSKINDEVKKISDNEFVKQISVINDEAVTKKFLNAYIEWKEQYFVQNVNRIIQDFREEVEKNVKVKIDKRYEGLIKEIEENYFQCICGKIEAMHLTNDQMEDRLIILNLEIDEHKKKYYLDCEVSEKLCFTIYNVNLDQSEIEEMDKNESFIPKPIISENRTSFNIDPEIYEFKTIAQLGKKYLLFLWNIINNKLEIYLG
ncbi:1551_t:CDS:10, partial [Dentiscutata heterogama]